MVIANWRAVEVLWWLFESPSGLSLASQFFLPGGRARAK
jgi:hypothetical protein